MPCLENCAVCTSGDYCTTCKPGFNLGMHGTACISICPLGEYYDIVSKSCKLCVDFCEICTGANECTTCFNNLTVITSPTNQS